MLGVEERVGILFLRAFILCSFGTFYRPFKLVISFSAMKSSLNSGKLFRPSNDVSLFPRS